MSPNKNLEIVRRYAVSALVVALLASAHAGPNTWTGDGPFGGTVRKVVPDALVANRMYAVTNGNGVFRSDNAGDTWAPYVIDPDLVNNAWVTDFVVDPFNPDRLWALANAFSVLRSLDGGATWSAETGPFSDSLWFLLPDPDNEGTIYANALYSLYKSTDGGATWADISATLGLFVISELFFDPQNTSTLYASGWEGLFRSNDGGATWAHLTNGMPAPDASGYIFANAGAVDPRDSDTIFVNVSNEGIYKSTDGGLSFAPVSQVLPNDFFTQLAFDPADPDRIFLASGNNDLLASTDAGVTWLRLPNEGLDTNTINSLTFDPADASRILAAVGQKGVYASPDAGTSWSPSSQGLVNTTVFSLDIDSSSGRLWAGMGSGALSSIDSGATFEGYDSLFERQTLSILADEQLPGHVWAGSGCCGLFESFDNGQVWSFVDFSLPNTVATGLTDLHIAFADPNRMFATDQNFGAFASVDRGLTWSDLGPALASFFVGNVRLHAVTSAPSDSDIVFIGSNHPQTPQGGVFKSTDGGLTWTRKSGGSTNVGISFVESLAVHPQDPNIVFAGGGGLVRSNDGGDTWALVITPAWGGVPDLYIDHARPWLMYYVARDRNLFRSVDGGTTWVEALADTGTARIESMQVDPANPSRVYIGLRNGGMREYTYSTGLSLTTDISAAQIATGETVMVTATLSNAGPLDANDASVNISVPPGFALVSAAPEQGSCSVSAAQATCNVQTVAVGNTANVEVVFEALTAGTVEAGLDAAALEVALQPANTVATVLLTAQGGSDTDGDGVDDAVDNCLLVENPGQQDSNADGYGNICDADLNNDCIVNAFDLGLFRMQFFSSDADADFNSDGTVNAADLGIMRMNFFMAPGPAGSGGDCDAPGRQSPTS